MRTAATLPRPVPHWPVPDPDAPGCCKRCHLVVGAGLHQEAQIAAFEAEQAQREAETRAAQQEQRRRVGDS